MKFYTNLFLSLFTFCSFLTNTSHAQAEKDYFITLWDLSIEKSTTIEFFAETSGEVNYTWETVPAGESGSGKFNVVNNEVIISNLPIKQIKLKLSPQNLKRFYFPFIDFVKNEKLIDVSQWGTIEWTSMELAFYNCVNLNISATDIPNLSIVSSAERMFYGCKNLNGPKNINSWNIQNVTTIEAMFSHASSFNQLIGDWNTQNVTIMSSMFSRASSFNQPIGNWNTRNVKDMSDMFAYASSFNQAIGNWNTQNVTDMTGVFWRATSFNQEIGTWNTQNVTDMNLMFYEAESFNQAIGNWNTQNVKDMASMFVSARLFNQPIGNWNTQNVTNMKYMFHEAKSFNQPIGNWNTQNVTDMRWMFYMASSFNQPIDKWNTHKVTNMSEIFNRASSFNQEIGTWNLQMVNNMQNMFSYCGMDCKNYSNTLIGWANNSITAKNIILGADGLKYSIIAKPSRDLLTKPVAEGGKGWKVYYDALTTEDCGLITHQIETAEQSNIALYPNPAQETLYLKNAPLGTKYSIFDGLGRLVSTGQCQNEAIDISALASGLYSLRLGNKPFNFVKE